MFEKLKQYRDLRNKAKELQNLLAQETVEVERNGTKLIMNGNQEITLLEINPDYLSPDKKKELEETIKDLTNEAIKKIQRVAAQKMQSLGGLNLPDGFLGQ